jgi:hypothetical protein
MTLSRRQQRMVFTKSMRIGYTLLPLERMVGRWSARDA